jgi:hypothetical protein
MKCPPALSKTVSLCAATAVFASFTPLLRAESNGSPRSGPAARRHDPMEAIPAALEQLAKQLRSDTKDQRESARAACLELHRTCMGILSAAVRDADDSDHWKTRALLHDIAAESEMTYAMVGLPPEQQEKLTQLREKNPGLVWEAFSPSWSRRVQAIKRIRAWDDPRRLGEPILILGASHDSQDLVLASADAAATGKYRSQALLDALAGALLRLGPAGRTGRYELGLL